VPNNSLCVLTRIATARCGREPFRLHHFDGRHFVTYNTQIGLSNIFLSIYQDKRGDLDRHRWRRIEQTQNGRFSSYTSRDGLTNDIVWSISGDADGHAWLARTAVV